MNDDNPLNLGPTGNFPQGKLNNEDDGEIRIAIGNDPDTGKVMIHFGAPIAWLAMSRQEAIDLATKIFFHARM